jgi:hypothetical protein
LDVEMFDIGAKSNGWQEELTQTRTEKRTHIIGCYEQFDVLRLDPRALKGVTACCRTESYEWILTENLLRSPEIRVIQQAAMSDP